MDQIWLKKVLVPIWVIEYIFDTVLLALAILAFVAVGDYEHYEEDDGYQPYYGGALDIGAIIVLIFALAGIAFDISECVLLSKNKLKPVLVVVFSSITTAIWCIYWVLALLTAFNNENGVLLGFIFGLLLFCCGLAKLIYSSIIFHRQRKGTLHRYTPAGLEDYGPAPSGSYAAYNPAQEPRRDPFRDPSPVPSAQSAMHPKATHPAFRTNGAADDYYGGDGSFEMANARTSYGV